MVYGSARCYAPMLVSWSLLCAHFWSAGAVARSSTPDNGCTKFAHAIYFMMLTALNIRHIYS